MRTSNVPGFVTIDSTTLCKLLHTAEEGRQQIKLDEAGKKKIWKRYFKIDTRQFKDFYFFIKTDAVSINIVCSSKKYAGFKSKKRKRKKSAEQNEKFPYANDWVTKKKENPNFDASSSTLVGVDPGVNQLLYATNGNKSDATHLSYTGSQRVKETKSKKSLKIRKEKERKTKVQGLSIESWNSLLKNEPQNTVGVNKFQKLYKQP